jgi:hypothetical protein
MSQPIEPLSRQFSARTAVKVVTDIVVFAGAAFLAAKTLGLVFIALYNLLGVEQRLSYALLYANWGKFYRTAELHTLLNLLVLAPLIETALFCIVIWKVCARLGLGIGAFIAISAVGFGVLHFRISIFSGLDALILGLLLAWIFARYVENHIVVAFGVAALTHSAYNALVCLV